MNAYRVHVAGPMVGNAQLCSVCSEVLWVRSADGDPKYQGRPRWWPGQHVASDGRAAYTVSTIIAQLCEPYIPQVGDRLGPPNAPAIRGRRESARHFRLRYRRTGALQPSVTVYYGRLANAVKRLAGLREQTSYLYLDVWAPGGWKRATNAYLKAEGVLGLLETTPAEVQEPRL